MCDLLKWVINLNSVEENPDEGPEVWTQELFIVYIIIVISINSFLVFCRVILLSFALHKNVNVFCILVLL